MNAPTTFRPDATHLHDYIARMHARLSEQARRDYGVRMKTIANATSGEVLTPQGAVATLRRKVAAGELAHASFRHYKSAVQYWLGQQAEAAIAGGVDFAAYANAFDQLDAIDFSALAPEDAGGGNVRLKRFPAAAVAALEQYVERQRHLSPYYADGALKFVRANLLVGLRPIEWFDAQFASYIHRDAAGRSARNEDNKTLFTLMLVVRNAKQSHGRGNGTHRELLLTGVTAAELEAIAAWRNWLLAHAARQSPDLSQEQIAANLYRGAIAKLMRRSFRKAGLAATDMPTIYGTRHQAVADLKASGANAYEVAAFFGHRSPKTAKEHYGKRVHGDSKRQFRPSIESVKAVNRRAGFSAPQPLSASNAQDLRRWLAESESRSRDSGMSNPRPQG